MILDQDDNMFAVGSWRFAVKSEKKVSCWWLAVGLKDSLLFAVCSLLLKATAKEKNVGSKKKVGYGQLTAYSLQQTANLLVNP